MLRPADLVVLLALLTRDDEPWTLRSLAERLQVPLAAVQRSLSRLNETPVFDAADRRLNLSACDELLAHALPFIAPASLGAPARGVPTAWGAAPLVEEIAADDLAPVWPDAKGKARGLALKPLHVSVPALAGDDQPLYEVLALVDALRVGRARERKLALAHLRKRLFEKAAAPK